MLSDAGLITPVILSGGGGTRLWPLSRPDRPKQFLALAGDETMLQVTVRRVRDHDRYTAPVIIASAIHLAEIEAQLRAVDCMPGAVILEPAGRNTAPAIALAALDAEPDALLLVMPSDHVIEKLDAFQEAVSAGVPLARDGWLVTFGIAPTAPETGYGYIKLGHELGGGAHAVERFIEKPSLPKAEAMIAEGGHAWNGGIFLFRAGDYLSALEQFAPEILIQARAALAGAIRDKARVFPDRDSFMASPAQSIDYAVMEKAKRVAVVPVDLGWSDVGSWDALYELGRREGESNSVAGDTRLIDSEGCLVRGEGIRVSALGIRDLIVVATKDEVLIIPRGRSQEVRRLLTPE